MVWLMWYFRISVGSWLSRGEVQDFFLYRMPFSVTVCSKYTSFAQHFQNKFSFLQTSLSKLLTQNRTVHLGWICKMSYSKIRLYGGKSSNLPSYMPLSGFFSLILFTFYLYACLIQRWFSDTFLTVKFIFKCVRFQEPDPPLSIVASPKSSSWLL